MCGECSRRVHRLALSDAWETLPQGVIGEWSCEGCGYQRRVEKRTAAKPAPMDDGYVFIPYAMVSAPAQKPPAEEKPLSRREVLAFLAFLAVQAAVCVCVVRCILLWVWGW